MCGTCSSKNEAYIPGIVFGYEFISQVTPFFPCCCCDQNSFQRQRGGKNGLLWLLVQKFFHHSKEGVAAHFITAEAGDIETDRKQCAD